MWKQVTHLSVFFVWNVLRGFEKRVLSFINDNEEVLCPYWQEAHNGFVFQRIFFPTCLLYKFNRWEDIFSLPESNCYLLFFFLSHFKAFICAFIFGCAGSSLLRRVFSGCSQWGLLSGCGAQAFHRGGFSCCGAQALGYAGCRNCGMGAQRLGPPGSKHRLSTYDRWA